MSPWSSVSYFSSYLSILVQCMFCLAIFTLILNNSCSRKIVRHVERFSTYTLSASVQVQFWTYYWHVFYRIPCQRQTISLLLAASLPHRFNQSWHFTSKWLLAILPIHYGCNCDIVYSRVCTIAKSDSLASSCLPLCLSVRPSAWNNSAPTEGIFMIFYISFFF